MSEERLEAPQKIWLQACDAEVVLELPASTRNITCNLGCKNSQDMSTPEIEEL